MSYVSQQATHKVTTEITSGGEANSNKESVRKICMRMILAGKSNAEIGEVLKKEHPTTAAAHKVTKHVSWYRSTMKKAGQLPADHKAPVSAGKVNQPTEQVTLANLSVEELQLLLAKKQEEAAAHAIARQQELLAARIDLKQVEAEWEATGEEDDKLFDQVVRLKSLIELLEDVDAE